MYLYVVLKIHPVLKASLKVWKTLHRNTNGRRICGVVEAIGMSSCELRAQTLVVMCTHQLWKPKRITAILDLLPEVFLDPPILWCIGHKVGSSDTHCHSVHIVQGSNVAVENRKFSLYSHRLHCVPGVELITHRSRIQPCIFLFTLVGAVSWNPSKRILCPASHINDSQTQRHKQHQGAECLCTLCFLEPNPFRFTSESCCWLFWKKNESQLVFTVACTHWVHLHQQRQRVLS